MKEIEAPKKASKPTPKVTPTATRPNSMEKLHAMSTDELVKLLLSPDMAKPVNQSVRQMIIEILQQREGNAFVQRLLGKSSAKK